MASTRRQQVRPFNGSHPSLITWRFYALSSPSFVSSWSSFSGSQPPSWRDALTWYAYRFQNVMLCKKPFSKGSLEFGCGQCMPCRINRKRLWVARLILESTSHADFQSWFVTLTYAPEHLPDRGALVPRHFQLFMKRLRKRLDYPVRYFGVGEYGDQSARPHYHVLLFGFRGVELRVRRGITEFYSSILNEAWPLGLVHIGCFSPQSAQYVAGYITKKMTNKDDARLEGRHPEFARMSLRPGIGGNSLDPIINFVSSEQGAAELVRTDAIPSEIRLGRKTYPLGKYLRSRIASGAGYDPRAVVRVSFENQVIKALEAAVDLDSPGKKLSRREAAAAQAAQIVAFSKQRKIL